MSARHGRRASTWRLVLVALGVTGVHHSALGAQPPSPPPAERSAQHPGSQIKVWLMTMGHGDAIWERFGHNAIRVQDAAAGTDLAYNWGIFDFEEPGFLGRFLTGDTRYWMEGWPALSTVEAYRQANRSIWLQELDLTPAQRVALRDFIAWNARPENRYYRYDYYRDNCSTRVRDALDRVLGGQIRRATAERLTRTTYRWHTRRVLQDQLATYTGIQIALGEPADAPISAWDEMFLPTRMQAILRDLEVRDEQGRLVPLVSSEQQIFAASRPPEPSSVPTHMLGFLLAGLFIAIAVIGLAIAGARGSRGARRAAVTFTTLWALLAGIIGVLLVIAWTATRHVFWVHNENLLQFSPVALALALLVPLGASRPRFAAAARITALGVAAIALFGLVLALLPSFGQSNAEVIALALPITLAIAGAVLLLTSPSVALPRPRR